MKKVLIITYYWPPSGGSGVQRWLKFAKYLPAFGWQPIVFTPEKPSFAIRDESLLQDVPAEAEVVHFPIWEPYDLFFKMSAIFGGGQRSAKPTELVSAGKSSAFQRLSTWIRGNFFIPDPRVFWVKPSVKFLNNFIKDNNIETVITTGPPHSVHLIGYRLKRKNPTIKWLADFRDPWTRWGLLDTVRVGFAARKVHKKLEANVLSLADEILTITPFYVRQFQEIAQRKVTLLTNGFDPADFKGMNYTQSDKFIIRHVGIVNEKCNPRFFMQALKEMIAKDHEFGNNVIMEFIGEVHPQFREFVSRDPKLKAITLFRGNIPHKQLINLYGEASVLLFVLTGYKDAEGYLPGKLFEYLATGLPIIGIGPPHGDAANLLHETGAGAMIMDGDWEPLKKKLISLYAAWSSGTAMPRKKATDKYSRKELTRFLSELL